MENEELRKKLDFILQRIITAEDKTNQAEAQLSQAKDLLYETLEKLGVQIHVHTLRR
jgi:hypothetical protein